MRIGIIGAGAAGLMCAATILETHPNAEIFLFERNNGLGKKVIISGGGRCNVTTGIRDVPLLLKNYPRGSKFLNSAMYGFPPEMVYAWFESRGVPLKTQDDNRVFPVSDNGEDIVRVFEQLFQNAPNVHVLLRTHVVGVAKHHSGFAVSTKNEPEPILVDKLVLTTGGQAYRHTGSTGDGYAFAQSLGHTLTPLAPSLNAFFTKESWPAQISGLSFQEASITAHTKTDVSFSGPFLFTHKGISGPGVFTLSSLVAFEPYDKQNPLHVTIDLFPAKSTPDLLGTLDKLTEAEPQKQFKTILSKIIPKSLVEILLHELSISGSKAGSQTSKKDKAACVAWLKSLPLHIVQRGAGDEFVTAGGIPLSEVNPSTMESRICPGLFFAGEILDVDGFTGGFNLQASWAAGRLAGSRILGLFPNERS
jgi:predicted Rossmann fold flavoprotein